VGGPIQYINDYLYFVIRPETRERKDVLVYCSGVNLRRLLPITGGRHGLASSPALRGLQIVNRGLRALALSKHIQPKTVKEKLCPDITFEGDLWFSESLLFENAPESFPDEMIAFCVNDFLRSLNKSCCLGEILPEKLLKADELQELFEDWSRKYDVIMRRSEHHYRFTG
jgi:hypothetical protein